MLIKILNAILVISATDSFVQFDTRFLSENCIRHIFDPLGLLIQMGHRQGTKNGQKSVKGKGILIGQRARMLNIIQ
jgi:hypothetical protein